MKRPLRIFFLSLLLTLFAGVSVLWPLSYWRGMFVTIKHEWFESKIWTERRFSLDANSGALSVDWDLASADESEVGEGAFPERVGKWHAEADLRPAAGYPEIPGDYTGDSWHGFAYGRLDGMVYGRWHNGYESRYIIPLPAIWLPLAAWVAAISIQSLRRRRRIRHRLAKGLCPACAYDLRAHTPGDKCPECGAPILSRPAAPAK